MSAFESVPDSYNFSFPKSEEAIQELWIELDAFNEQLRRSEGRPEYVFYDGPPFATGLPHYGHILAGTIKDIVTRYACSSGFHVSRRFGWDCHGLPVEFEIDKKLGISAKEDILKFGIDKYNEECRGIVMRFSKEWETSVKRLGRWIDFENDYKTLDPTFMESVWWVFKQLFDKDLVYKGFKVMPYSTACTTPLANFEVGLNYKDVMDPAVIVNFPIIDAEDGACLVAWTTTPWTLPSNLALCVHPEFDYLKVQDPKTGKIYVVAESRLSSIPGAVPKKKKGGKKGKKGGDKAAEANKEEEGGFKILEKFKGATLIGKRYEPLFPYFKHLGETGAFQVVSDTYVTDDAGTGIVHQAPAYGEDDYRVCIKHGVIQKGAEIPDPLDANARFLPVVTDFEGKYIKDADKEIIKYLKQSNRIVDVANLKHSYPFCWRSDTPLIYRAVPSWFVKVESFKDKLVENNKKTYWVPSYVKEKRFHNWLEGAHDWAVSRNRYWGTPIPVWISEDGEEVVVIGSIQELEELTGEKVTDLHRHFIDHLEIPSRQGKGVLRRIDEVFDCWFESGSMPYAQQHYPFENKEKFENSFPAHFIAEGIDQTRGWFYTLMVLSTALFDKPPFQNLICNGLVLAEDGKKMSKRLKNYPDPRIVVDAYGADALRLYLVNSPVVRAESLRFKEEGVLGVLKEVFLPWYNAYRFFIQNAQRLGENSNVNFDPKTVDLNQASNVLDRWMIASTTSLVEYVKQEMEAYHLYTVLPYLVKFIGNLTNVYVRFNRKRLKGSNGVEDCKMALAVMFDCLMTLCKVMAPFTPYLTELMYQNLNKCLTSEAGSVHWELYPDAEKRQKADESIQKSVARMQKVIEIARLIRDRKSRPTKLPLKEMTIVHPDESFLADLTGDLQVYLTEEINVRTINTSTDITKYSTAKAEPDWGALGKRLGKAMGLVAKAIKSLDGAAIAEFESKGEITVEGHLLKTGDLKIVRQFQTPEGVNPDEIDADGDGEVLVILNLKLDEELVQAGTAREIVNRVQKLRKKAGLEPSDKIEFYYDIADAKSGLEKVFEKQKAYFVDAIGTTPKPVSGRQAHSVSMATEVCVVGDDAKFTAILARPSVVPNTPALEQLSGGAESATSLGVWLSSLSLETTTKSESSDGKLSVKLDGKAYTLQAGVHFEWNNIQ
jgi:isoleucyl-tRNA synthetase